MVASIIIPGRSTRQPAGYAGIDWDRFAPTMAFLGGSNALVGRNGGRWTANSGTYVSGGPAGAGIHFNGSTIAYATLATAVTPFTGPLVIGGVYLRTGALQGSPGAVVALGATAATTWAFVGPNQYSNYSVVAGAYSGSLETGVQCSSGNNVNAPVACAVKFVSATDFRTFVNGVQYNSTTSLGTQASSTYFCIGGAWRNGSAATVPPLLGTVTQAWIDTTKNYDDGELLAWSENPWSLVRLMRRLYFGAATAAHLPLARVIVQQAVNRASTF